MVHPGTTNFGLVKIQTGKQTVRKSASFSQFHFFFSSTQQDLELGDNVKKTGRKSEPTVYYYPQTRRTDTRHKKSRAHELL